MKAVAISIVICAAATAQAAPWSFELPAGFTEQPGAADVQLAQLRKQPTTVSVDAQIYLSQDGVQLTRMTWLIRIANSPDRPSLEDLDRGVVAGGAKRASKHVSDSRHWVGDQLVAETIDEVGDSQVRQRRIYAADTAGVVHMFGLICAGVADQLADCEKAQQTMQLKIPHEAALLATSPPKKIVDLPFIIGQVSGFLIVAIILVWYVLRRRNRAAR